LAAGPLERVARVFKGGVIGVHVEDAGVGGGEVDGVVNDIAGE